jgi:hypothetical protein
MSVRGWVVLLAVALVGPVAAADGGRTPYSTLYRALAPAREVGEHPRLRAVQRIESKLPGVRPQQIEVRIHARSGDIAVPIAADGAAQFPLRDDLLAEDPPVSSNQPKGSITLSVTLALRVPDSTRLSAADLRAALADVDAWLVEQGNPGAPTRGVEFRFPPGSGASLTVRGDTERFLLADDAGRIVVVRDPDLDTAIGLDLSQRPLEVLPWIAP